MLGSNGNGAKRPSFAAVDFGASSGRVLTGELHDGRLWLTERARFVNQPVRLPDGLHWNLLSLFQQSLEALRSVGPLRSIGIDTWAVDYGLLDARRRLLGLPYHYRDARTDGMAAQAYARVPKADQYAIAGLQELPFNTAFQFLADDAVGALNGAEHFAMVPDLLALWFTGELTNERTNASTTGLLDARTGEWSRELISGLGLPDHLFGALVEPGELIGHTLRSHGLKSLSVHAVASHDTASAFVAAPVAGEHDAVLSSGTWSLLGLELPAPVLTPEAMAADLTNERGIDGTTRLLKNVMGLWLEQECARTWNASHAELFAAAEGVELTDELPLFDPDLPQLLQPGDMPSRIAEACVSTGQKSPRSRGDVIGAILVSLACKYRYVLDLLERTSGRDIRRIHVIGGGAQVDLLCRLTADITGREVRAGAVEATATGNILVQTRAIGELDSLAEMREIAAASTAATSYVPRSGNDAGAVYQRFLDVTGLPLPVSAGA